MHSIHIVQYVRECSWNQYKNLTNIYKEKEVEEEITLDSLKKLFYDSKSELDTYTQLIIAVKNYLIHINQ